MGPSIDHTKQDPEYHGQFFSPTKVEELVTIDLPRANKQATNAWLQHLHVGRPHSADNGDGYRYTTALGVHIHDHLIIIIMNTVSNLHWA